MNLRSKLLFAICLLLGFVFVVSYTVHLRRSSYNVSLDVISYDNFYDIEKEEFVGEVQTLSNIGFELIDTEDDPVLKSFFSVHTLQGSSVVDVVDSFDVIRNVFYRDLEISEGQRYVLDSGVFTAPNSIYFRQPNYSTNSEYRYDGEVFRGGIKLYKYVARFDSDQTDALKHLDAVSKRGNRIVTSVNSELWFEPVSGRLVNYKEDSIAYEVDSTTGRTIRPSNHFRNSVSESGIVKQVSKAKEVRDIVLVMYALLTVLSFVYIYLLIRSLPALSLFKKRGYKADVLVIILLSLAFYTYYYIPKGQGEIRKVAVLTWSNTELGTGGDVESFVANINEYENSSKTKVEVTVFSAEGNRTKAIKEIDTIVTEGYDLIMVISDPAALLVQSYVSVIPVVFTDVSHPLRLGLIDSYLSSGNNFVGVVNRVPAANQIRFFKEIQPDLENLYIVQNSEDIASFTKDDFNQDSVGLNSVFVITKDILLQKTNLVPEEDAMYLPCDFSYIDTNSIKEILQYSEDLNVPIYSCQESLVLQGATAGLVPDSRLMGVVAGQYAGRILSGIAPNALETILPSNSIRYVNRDSLSAVERQVTKRLLETSKVVNSN